MNFSIEAHGHIQASISIQSRLCVTAVILRAMTTCAQFFLPSYQCLITLSFILPVQLFHIILSFDM